MLDETKSALNRLAVLKGAEIPFAENSVEEPPVEPLIEAPLSVNSVEETTKVASPRSVRVRIIESSFDELSKIALANNDEPIAQAIKSNVNFLTDAAQGPFHLIRSYEDTLTKEATNLEKIKADLKDKFKTKLA